MKGKEIKPRDLMYGDLVNFMGSLHRVTSVHGDIFFLDGVLNPLTIVGEPIEITDEIMKKNFPEFEPGYEIGWWSNANGTYQVEWNDDEHKIILNEVHYVHEIQHLLKMVGRDKEFVL